MNHGNGHGIPELFVCPCIGHRNNEFIRKALKPGSLTRSQLSRILSGLFDQDLAAVLVISGTDRVCIRAVLIEQTVAEALAGSCILMSAALMTGPQPVADRIFRINVLFQDVTKSCRRLWRNRIFEISPVGNLCLVETDDVYTFPVLRDPEILCGKDPVIYGIVHIEKSLPDRRKSISVIMSEQILYILHQTCLRTFFLNDTGDIKEKSAPRVGKTSLESGLTERLTRKTADQDIVIRNVFLVNLRDIAVWLLTEIRTVRFLRIFVKLIRENNIDCPCLSKSQTGPADTGEQINHSVTSVRIVGKRHRFRKIKNGLNLKRRRFCFAVFPSSDRPVAVLRHSCRVRKFLLRHSETFSFFPYQLCRIFFHDL